MTDPLPLLLASEDPTVRFKARRLQAGGSLPVQEEVSLREAVRSSQRVRMLLSERQADGTIPLNPYHKWRGAHWVLPILADIGYPAGDAELIPLREQVLACWLSDAHFRAIRCYEGRTRRCASQEGNAAWALLTLGLADERVDTLIERLISWQWPDGGWNCDKRPEAHNSSFHETLIPLRALAADTRISGSSAARSAAERAAEVFLKRRLFLRQSDGTLINPRFTRLYYPSYWHYDILAGLKVLAEAGFIADKRCNEALDLLESKRLPDGGFPAEGRHYRVGADPKSGHSLVDWGPISKRRMNPFVTLDALYVLKSAGRQL
ncbi:MAG: hypothetical protein ACYC6L_02445 [Anaerolineae bacterium]